MKTIKPEKLTITNNMLQSGMAQMIKKIDDLGLNPSETAIIAIGRGGFVPAQYAAYALDINDLFSIQSVLYNNENKKTKTHHVSGAYNIPYEEFKTFLVIDDMIDSGTTLDNVVGILEDTAGAIIGKSFNDYVPTFIPCVVYTQKSKKKMKKMKARNIIWGRKIKKVDGVHPWLMFPWDLLTPNDTGLEATR